MSDWQHVFWTLPAHEAAQGLGVPVSGTLIEDSKCSANGILWSEKNRLKESKQTNYIDGSTKTKVGYSNIRSFAYSNIRSPSLLEYTIVWVLVSSESCVAMFLCCS